MCLSMSTQPANRRTRAAERPHADAAFDPEPTRTLGPDEPPTPAWIPIVGAVVLVAVAIAVVARMAADRPPAVGASDAPAVGASTPSPFTGGPLEASARRPSATLPGGVARPTPDQVREVRRKMDEYRASKKAAEPAAP
jgi:hypothetical protein